MTTKQNYPEIREAVAKLCARFPGEYWRDLDRRMAYPSEFVGALTEAGWLSVLIPEEYGGAGLPLSAAAAVLEEIQRAGCNGGACHAQMYTMGTVLRHGSEAQKRRHLPEIAAGRLRLQAFSGRADRNRNIKRVSLVSHGGKDLSRVGARAAWRSRGRAS